MDDNNFPATVELLNKLWEITTFQSQIIQAMKIEHNEITARLTKLEQYVGMNTFPQQVGEDFFSTFVVTQEGIFNE